MRKSIIVLAALSLAFGAVLAAQGQTPQGQTPQVQAAGGWREVDPQNILIIDTSKGRIIAELAPAVAPKSVERIKVLTRQGIYDNRAFFRVIDGFMAQTGDPQDTGTGGSALPDIEPEFTFRRGRDMPLAQVPNTHGIFGFVGVMPVRSEPDAQMAITADGKVRATPLFCKGVLGMARSDEPNSANSQFYLMRDESEPLNGRYAAFGRVISGLDVVRAIKAGDPQSGQVAEPMDKMTKVRIMADLPEDERPKIRVQATNSPEFTSAVAARAKARGGNVDICDLDIPSSVQ